MKKRDDKGKFISEGKNSRSKEYKNKIIKEYRKKYPEKIKARVYANNHKFKREKCLICLLKGKKTKAKEFHHTDYESNLGFSVCLGHHKIADSWGEASA